LDKIKEILLEDKWKKNMAKRNLQFFHFTAEWCEYVYKTITDKYHTQIPWMDLHGYDDLVKIFMYEMINRDVC